MSKKAATTRVFVVEDDPMYQRMVKYIMELNPDYEVHVFGTGEECIRNLGLRPNIISLDYTLPDMTGEEILKKIKQFDERINVVILSGQQDIATAVKLLKNGAYDYITKDQETKDRLINILNNINNHQELQNEVETLREELNVKYEFGNSIIGNSKPMLRIFQLLEKAVKTDITVSITGETGTGKEVVAKSIHHNSTRKKGPFIAVNMSAIPNELVESELFGYEKGAFTGALTRKKGQFELANNGTLFLDEIAELDLNHQAKMLRALQEREVMRVGGEAPVKFNARILIATHRDLAEEVRKGNFREDLYYRLIGLNVSLPPLRERGNDILLLGQHFLNDFVKTQKMGKLEISKEGKKKLLEYRFPGNVRELKAIMELAAVMADGKTVEPDDIQFNSVRREENFMSEEMSLEEYKHRIIRHFLQKYDDDVLLVAKKLDIGKSTIYRLLKEESALN